MDKLAGKQYPETTQWIHYSLTLLFSHSPCVSVQMNQHHHYFILLTRKADTLDVGLIYFPILTAETITSIVWSDLFGQFWARK